MWYIMLKKHKVFVCLFDATNFGGCLLDNKQKTISLQIV